MRERHEVEQKYFSAVTPGAYPEEVPVVGDGRMSREAMPFISPVAGYALQSLLSELYSASFYPSGSWDQNVRECRFPH